MSELFKKNLTFLRERKGEKQSETASILGLTRSTYANYETGANIPKADILVKIIGHFGVSFEEIMNIDLSNVHLNTEETESGKGKNVHLNVHPSVHLNAKKGVNKPPLNADKTGSEIMEKLVQSLEKVIAGQDSMIQLQANKIAELEEINRRLQSEIPQIGQPMEDRKKETG